MEADCVTWDELIAVLEGKASEKPEGRSVTKELTLALRDLYRLKGMSGQLSAPHHYIVSVIDNLEWIVKERKEATNGN